MNKRYIIRCVCRAQARLQLYQFTVVLSVILLSSDGPKPVNYGIYRLSMGLSFQRQTLTVPADHPHPLSVDLALPVWSYCMQTPSLCVCMYSANTETCRNPCKAWVFTNTQVCLSCRVSSLVFLLGFFFFAP